MVQRLLTVTISSTMKRRVNSRLLWFFIACIYLFHYLHNFFHWWPCFRFRSKTFQSQLSYLQGSFGRIYFPSNRESIVCFNFLLSPKYGLIQSTRLCLPLGRVVSSACKPVSISTKTTPKPYTSLFTYKCPVEQTQCLVLVALKHAEFEAWKSSGITCCHILWSSVAICSHNPCCYMWLTSWWTQFCQTEVWDLGIIGLQEKK